MNISDESNNCQITLEKIKPGSLVVVDKILESYDNETRRRIMDVGIIPGTFLRVIKIAPWGDPIQISLLDFDLVIRKSDAKRIVVRIIEENIK